MNHQKINRMVGIAVLSALVVVLQLLSSVIKIGTVSITLTLIPIVVGAAFYGPASARARCPAGAPVLFTGSLPGRTPPSAAMPSPFCWLPSPRRS